MIVKIPNREIQRYLERSQLDLPKYVSQFLNLVNQIAQGTRPKTVGQMSELFKESKSKTLAEWEKWYCERNPQTIEAATDKIWQMMLAVKVNIEKIDRKMVMGWVKDLVIVKTYIGLGCQEVILKKGAELLRTDFRFATPAEEAKGIDGYLGQMPVSIKPHTYKSKAALPEDIDAKIIYYEKIKSGLKIDFGDIA